MAGHDSLRYFRSLSAQALRSIALTDALSCHEGPPRHCPLLSSSMSCNSRTSGVNGEVHTSARLRRGAAASLDSGCKLLCAQNADSVPQEPKKVPAVFGDDYLGPHLAGNFRNVTVVNA